MARPRIAADRRALAIGDDATAPGFVGERLSERGIEVVVAVRGGPEPLPSLDGFDVLVPLGSVWSVDDPAFAWWMDTELATIRAAVEAGLPVLGICFGAQAMSAALGGVVGRAARPEIGWYTVESDVPDVIPPGPWFEWHGDTFTVPDGAVELARSPVGPQAFRVGPHLAVQFHPEVTGEILRSWVIDGHGELSRENLDGAAILAAGERHLPVARLACHRLVDHFLDSAFG
ncbi:MAG: type 1 glutamine amidotransferase [Acidimicrobiales bacterium]|nr:type 1 glutamine amidotransferase [Acidimicrobiales bacterium]